MKSEYKAIISGDTSGLISAIKEAQGEINKISDNEILIRFDYDGDQTELNKLIKKLEVEVPGLAIQFKYDFNKEMLEREEAKLKAENFKLDVELDTNKLVDEFEDLFKAYNSGFDTLTDVQKKRMGDLYKTLIDRGDFSKVSRSIREEIEDYYKSFFDDKSFKNLETPILERAKKISDNINTIQREMNKLKLSGAKDWGSSDSFNFNFGDKIEGETDQVKISFKELLDIFNEMKTSLNDIAKAFGKVDDESGVKDLITQLQDVMYYLNQIEKKAGTGIINIDLGTNNAGQDIIDAEWAKQYQNMLKTYNKIFSELDKKLFQPDALFAKMMSQFGGSIDDYKKQFDLVEIQKLNDPKLQVKKLAEFFDYIKRIIKEGSNISGDIDNVLREVSNKYSLPDNYKAIVNRINKKREQAVNPDDVRNMLERSSEASTTANDKTNETIVDLTRIDELLVEIKNILDQISYSLSMLSFTELNSNIKNTEDIFEHFSSTLNEIIEKMKEIQVTSVNNSEEPLNLKTKSLSDLLELYKSLNDQLKRPIFSDNAQDALNAQDAYMKYGSSLEELEENIKEFYSTYERYNDAMNNDTSTLVSNQFGSFNTIPNLQQVETELQRTIVLMKQFEDEGGDLSKVLSTEQFNKIRVAFELYSDGLREVSEENNKIDNINAKTQASINEVSDAIINLTGRSRTVVDVLTDLRLGIQSVESATERLGGNKYPKADGGVRLNVEPEIDNILFADKVTALLKGYPAQIDVEPSEASKHLATMLQIMIGDSHVDVEATPMNTQPSRFINDLDDILRGYWASVDVKPNWNPEEVINEINSSLKSISKNQKLTVDVNQLSPFERLKNKIKEIGFSAVDLKDIIDSIYNSSKYLHLSYGDDLDNFDRVHKLKEVLKEFGYIADLTENTDAFSFSGKIKKLTEEISAEGNAAEKAAQQKNEFDKANQKIGQHAPEVANEVDKVSEAIKEEGAFAENADLTKWLTEIQSTLKSHPLLLSMELDKAGLQNQLKKIAPEIANELNKQYGTTFTGKDVVKMYNNIRKQQQKEEQERIKEESRLKAEQRKKDEQDTKQAHADAKKWRQEELDYQKQRAKYLEKGAKQQEEYNKQVENQRETAKKELETKYNSEENKAVSETNKLYAERLKNQKEISRLQVENVKVKTSDEQRKQNERDILTLQERNLEITKQIEDANAVNTIKENEYVEAINKANVELEDQVRLSKESISKDLSTKRNKLDELTNGKFTQEYIENLRKAVIDFDKALDNIDSDSLSEVESKAKKLQEVFDELYGKKGLSEVKLAAQSQLERLGKMIDDIVAKNTKMGNSFKSRFDVLKNALNTAESRAEVEKLKAQIISLEAELVRAGKTGKNFMDIVRERATSITAQMVGQWLSLYDIIRYIRTAVGTIKELDNELVDLKKTTTMSASELERFYMVSSDIGKQMGVTTADIIKQASAWSRLGYSSNEAATEMAKLSSQFAAISPGMDLQNATDGLVSAMKAFHIEVDDVQREIMDNINVIGNKMATSNDEIVEMLKRSSAAMNAANNSIKDTIALESAAVQITRNAETTGTAFRTISMRIRGKKSMPPYMETYMLCA